MHQVIFRIPFKPFDWLPEWWPQEVPIYGFGLMLFITFLVCTSVATRRARREKIRPELLQDLAMWIFVAGLVGARIVFMIQYDVPPQQFFMIWQGGLVFYGSAIGGVVGFILGYFFVLRKHGVSPWKVADIIAPCCAIGLAIGRIGCFLNGCCYGNVACPDCPAVHFPLSAPARYQLVSQGYQTVAGFTLTNPAHLDPRTVGAVAPGSGAARVGLRPRDVLVHIETRANGERAQSWDLMTDHSLPRTSFFWLPASGEALSKPVEVRLTVQRDGKPLALDPIELTNRTDYYLIDMGFTMADCAVDEIDPSSPAHRDGLLKGDLIVRVNDRPINFAGDLHVAMGRMETWKRGDNSLRLAVVHPGQPEPAELTAFEPRTLGLHPTQLYESISMGLLFLLLTALYPFRRRDGVLMVAFALCYGVHRFLNEMLRNDTDPVAFGMTLSQNGSILFFVAGLGLLVWLLRQPMRHSPGTTTA